MASFGSFAKSGAFGAEGSIQEILARFFERRWWRCPYYVVLGTRRRQQDLSDPFGLGSAGRRSGAFDVPRLLRGKPGGDQDRPGDVELRSANASIHLC